MRAILLLSLLSIALPHVGTAVAEPPEDSYYVRVTAHRPEPPAARDPSYDCSAERGPEGLSGTLQYNLDALTDGERWGLPYVAPGCLAVDVGDEIPDLPPITKATSQACAGPIGTSQFVSVGALPISGCRMGSVLLQDASAATPIWTLRPDDPGARASYNLSSGDYFLHLNPGLAFSDAATASTVVTGFPRNVSGNSGLAVQFDCVECPPPW